MAQQGRQAGRRDPTPGQLLLWPPPTVIWKDKTRARVVISD